MTDNKSVKKYEALSGGLEVVESQLLDKLVETLNTEVSQNVICGVSQAINWLKGTFFFSRVKKNPRYSYLTSHVMRSLKMLNQEGLISLEENGMKVSPLPSSHIMSQYMVGFDAMKVLMIVPHNACTKHLLISLSDCKTLHRPVRRSEKKILNGVHTKIKYPLDIPPSKIRIQTPHQKVFVLLQAAIGQHYLEDYTLRQEMSFMVDDATRILSALEDYSVLGSKHGQVAMESLMLRRSLSTSLWGTKDGVLNQLRGAPHFISISIC